MTTSLNLATLATTISVFVIDVLIETGKIINLTLLVDLVFFGILFFLSLDLLFSGILFLRNDTRSILNPKLLGLRMIKQSAKIYPISKNRFVSWGASPRIMAVYLLLGGLMMVPVCLLCIIEIFIH
jgi:hypothetical protein